MTMNKQRTIQLSHQQCEDEHGQRQRREGHHHVVPSNVIFSLLLLVVFTTSSSALNNAAALITSNSNGQSPKYFESQSQHGAMMPHHLDVHKKKPLLSQRHDISHILFPGVHPNVYSRGTSISTHVELVDSARTRVPYDYYKLPVCPRPKSPSPGDLDEDSPNDAQKKSKKRRKNLGQLLTGHSVQPLGYDLQVGVDRGCTPLCRVVVPNRPLTFLRRLVKDRYRVHLTLDDLPVLMRREGFTYAVRGYPIGFVQEAASGNPRKKTNEEDADVDKDNVTGQNNSGTAKEMLYLYNHLRFTIYYNNNEELLVEGDLKPDDNIRITGFHVYPVSIAHSDPKDGKGWPSSPEDGIGRVPELGTCNPESGSALNQPETWLPLNTGAAGEHFSVVYSYEVEWKISDVKWADRWDIYLMETPDNEVHYFSIFNSLMVALLLTGAVAIIMIRALRKDIREYNDLEEQLVHPSSNTGGIPTTEESGWKLVHGDVFRPPRRYRSLLAIAVGTGVQIGSSVMVTLACLMTRKILDPMKRGQTLTGIIVLYVLSGSIAGYTSARLYRYFVEQEGTAKTRTKGWRRTALGTAVAFPGWAVSSFTVLNCVLWFRDAASAVSGVTIAMLFTLWVGVNTPLTLLGSYLGHVKSPRVTVPTSTSQIARFVPVSTSWFVRTPHCILLGGILPFASICIELYFVLGALWLHQMYYVMGFALLVCTILTLSTSTVSMVLTYLALCNEEYRWWWRSFWAGASAGIYLFGYSVWFLVMRLELVGFLPTLVYMTYMGIICVGFGLYCGGVGVLSSFWFCRKIYAAVKVD